MHKVRYSNGAGWDECLRLLRIQLRLFLRIAVSRLANLQLKLVFEDISEGQRVVRTYSEGPADLLACLMDGAAWRKAVEFAP